MKLVFLTLGRRGVELVATRVADSLRAWLFRLDERIGDLAPIENRKTLMTIYAFSGAKPNLDLVREAALSTVLSIALKQE